MDRPGARLTFVIVGRTSLPIRCAEMIRAAGHDVAAMVTADREVSEWARTEGIRVVQPGGDLSLVLTDRFDHLLSIVNDHILGDDVLKLPRGLVVNYHDAPLPKYAGTHATSWALMNGEIEHGVTWHVVTDLVDGGDILEQEIVSIEPEDSAFTLNIKCYDAALRSFGRLLESLSAGQVIRRQQDLRERTFFPRFKRPPNGGVIKWSQPASGISSLVRSLNFENQPNPLGCSKIRIDDNFYIVKEIFVTSDCSRVPAGTIVHLDETELRVATADHDVVFRRIFKLNSDPISVGQITSAHALTTGRLLPDLSEVDGRLIEQAYQETCRLESYQVSRLASVTPCEAPYSRPASKNEFDYGVSQVSISDASKLDSLAQANDLTKREVITATFALMLWRLSTIDEFDVAFIKLAEAKTVVDSIFENRLPLHFAPESSADFISFLSNASREISTQANAHPYATDLAFRFPHLREVDEADKPFRLPVAIIWADDPTQATAGAVHDLALVVSKDGDLHCLHYDRSKISDEDVQRLSRCFELMLDTLVVDPSLSIREVPLLSPDEFDKVINEWNDNAAAFPDDKCIHQLIESQVKLTPDRTALVDGDVRVTYKELNCSSNKLAAHLRSVGVGRETLVGVCLERTPELVCAVLAILKAGGAYVPLDPAYPPGRLTQILESSEAAVVVTTKKHAGLLSHHKGQFVFLDADRGQIDLRPETDLAPIVSSNNLAYVLYTSGSTGEPKGVAIEHRSVAALIEWARSVYTPEQLDGVLFSTSVCFDLSAFEMFVPLCSGGKVVIVENILHLPGNPAAKAVVLINTVPSAAEELLRIKGIPSSVRTVNLAGEPLRRELVERLYSYGEIQQVFDLYGPTEDTTYSTFTLRDLGPATIGRPISNTQAYILDRFYQPVPVGIPGELYLAGKGLARCYLNRPDLTAERFVRNPFGPTDSRMYRTGDLARFRDDGKIEYIGRVDNQVKIRGFRIELGEIEARMREHPAVREAVVVTHEDRHGDTQLVAYVVAAHDVDLVSSELRDYLKQKLPHFMVPAVVCELPKLPLTPNGKVDRRALPKASSTRPNEQITRSLDALESELVEIWERILGVTPIGLTDDFFELGGHSLQAVRMFAEVEEKFDRSIPLATLFEAGTIEKLAALLRQDGWQAPESSLVPIQPSGNRPPFFCIHAKGGNVLFYKDLAAHLGTDQPFFGLQARRLAGRQVGHDSVEEMAAFYIKEIKSLQPVGPYYIGGASFGGLAAFEMAQQLRELGDEVAMLALLDTGTPDYPQLLPTTTKLRSRLYSAIRRYQHHRDSLKLLGPNERLIYVQARLKKVRLKYRRRLRDKYRKTIRQVYARVGGVSSIPKKYLQIEDQIWKAGRKYKPRPYDGKVTLFLATLQPLGIVPDRTLGWGKHVNGEIEIHEVPGHHGAIVAEPFVRVLAEKLGKCIERTLQRDDESAGSVQHSQRSQQRLEAAHA